MIAAIVLDDCVQQTLQYIVVVSLHNSMLGLCSVLQVCSYIISCVQILEVALGCVLSADLSDLPTVLRFIMQQVSPRNALDVSCLSSCTHSLIPRLMVGIRLLYSLSSSNQIM